MPQQTETSFSTLASGASTAYNYGPGVLWKAPPVWADEKFKLSWLQRSLHNGIQFLQSNTAAQSFESSLNILANRIAKNLPKKLSKVQYNRLKRSVREILSTLTNINPRWDYNTQNESLTTQATILSKRLAAWWGMSFADRAIKRALQWAVVGAGYISPVWGAPTYGHEEPDVVLKVFGTMDFIPDQIHRDGDVQNCYVGHIRDTTPYAQALQTFPAAANLITPDRYTRTGAVATATRMISRWVAPIFNFMNMSGVSTSLENMNAPFPEVDIFYSYISDGTINETGKELHTNEFTTGVGDMADTRHTRWEYTVPTLGGPIKDGTFTMVPVPIPVPTGQMVSSPAGGMEPEILQLQQLVPQPNTRPAGRKDAMLYPLRRLIIWTNTTILYDGPSHYWHGKIPIVKFSMDQWHWEYLGYDIVEELRPAQEGLNDHLRGILDSLNLSLDPPTMHQEREFAKNTMANVNLRIPGTKIPVSGLVKDPVTPVLPYQHYAVQPANLEVQEMMKQQMDYQLGVQDLTAVAKLQQAPSAESIEKMLQLAGPIVQDYAREMEFPLTQLGYMFMWNIIEFDTTARRLQVLGRDGITKEDWDFQPGSLIPDRVPGVADDAPLMRKALLWGRMFGFHITPRSVFQITDMQTKLFYLQLWRDPKGFPMDPWTLAKMFNIPNFGEPPSHDEKGNPIPADIMSLWAYWMTQFNKFQVGLQLQGMAQMNQAQMLMQMQAGGMFGNAMTNQAGKNAMGGGGMPGPGGMPGDNRTPGRPPTGNKPPHIESKSDLEGSGPRSTIAES